MQRLILTCACKETCDRGYIQKQHNSIQLSIWLLMKKTRGSNSLSKIDLFLSLQNCYNEFHIPLPVHQHNMMNPSKCELSMNSPQVKKPYLFIKNKINICSPPRESIYICHWFVWTLWKEFILITWTNFKEIQWQKLLYCYI